MSKRRPSGDGMVRKKDDGRWEGRIVIGHKENGDSIFRYIYAPTQKELTAKLRQEITAYQGVDLTEDSKLTLNEWLDYWLDAIMAGLPSGPAHCTDTAGTRISTSSHTSEISRFQKSPRRMYRRCTKF